MYLQKIYNGKNRTFWFFTWEANKFGDPNVGGSMTSTVPREAWRNGDLSDLLKLGSNYQLYDPATIAPAANGRYSRLPLANNIFTASRIHPVARKLLELYPMPNQPGTNDAATISLPRCRPRRTIGPPSAVSTTLSAREAACSSAGTAISGKKIKIAPSITASMALS